jgi:hypothetical protein
MFSSSTASDYTQTCHTWKNVRFSDVTTLCILPESFTFNDIDQRDRVTKLSEVAYLRWIKAQAPGVKEPHIVAFAQLEQDRAAVQVFPDVNRDLMPVGQPGFVREFVWCERPHMVFNAALFLLEHNKLFCHHSALGQAYNLFVRDRVVLRPPLYRRAAFYQAEDGHWRARHFSLDDISLTMPDGTALAPVGARQGSLPFALNPKADAEIAVYTRACGLATVGHPLGRTPVEANRVEFTIVDTRIASCKTGGSSTQLFYQGGMLTTAGNRYGISGVQLERMIPSLGVLYGL